MPGQRGLQGRFIGWAAVAVLATYALFVGGAWAPTYSVFFRTMSLVLAAAGIATWIVVALRDPFWRPRSALLPAFAAALTVFLLSTLTSRFPRFGFEYLAWSIILTGLYLILQRLMASPFFRDRLVGFATFSALFIGAWYVVAVVARWIEWWSLVGRFTAPPLRPGFESLHLGNPSAVMTAIVLLSAPAVAAHWGRSRVRTALAVVLVTLCLFVIVVSGSRAGWLAIGLTVVAVGAFWLAAPERRSALTALLRSKVVRVAAVPVILAAAALAVVIGPGLLVRAGAGGESLRIGYFLASVRMFESSPLTGTGPGTWAPLRIANTAAGETDYYIPHAHNLYIQTLAEFGLVGVVVGLFVLALLARLLLAALRHPEPMTRRMGWASLFATVYFGAHQLLDFYANAPAILFVFAIPIAWLDGALHEQLRPWPRLPGVRSALSRARLPIAAAGALGFVLATGYLWWSESAATRMNDGTIALNDLKPQDAVEPLEAAVAMDPAMPPYRFALGIVLANTGQTERAEAEFLAAASADDLPEAWLNLAAVRTELGDADGAREALALALRLGVQQPAVALAAGSVYLELGDRARAVDAFTEAVLLLPSIIGDPWWEENKLRNEARDLTLINAESRATAEIRTEMAMELGDEVGAYEALASISNAETATTYELAVSAWFGDNSALDQLAERLERRPFDTTLTNWTARLFRRAGDAVTTQRLEFWTETVTALSSTGSFEARVVAVGDDFRVAGINSLFYGHFTYRRPTPSNQLVDSLPHLAYR